VRRAEPNGEEQVAYKIDAIKSYDFAELAADFGIVWVVER